MRCIFSLTLALAAPGFDDVLAAAPPALLVLDAAAVLPLLLAADADEAVAGALERCFSSNAIMVCLDDP